MTIKEVIFIVIIIILTVTVYLNKKEIEKLKLERFEDNMLQLALDEAVFATIEFQLDNFNKLLEIFIDERFERYTKNETTRRLTHLKKENTRYE